MNLDKLRAQIEILRMVKKKKADLKLLEDNAKAAIQHELGEHEIGELDGRIAVTWKHFKKRKFQQAKLKEDHPEIAEAYTELAEERRFEVTDE